MIDIHTHILPGVDDGAKTNDESLKMLEDLHKDGVTDVFLTPHIGRLRGFGASRDIYVQKLHYLREAAASRSLDINLHLGAEIDYSPDFVAEIDTYVTMNDTKTLLVDFTVHAEDIEDALYEAKLRGYTLIIAHPERTTQLSLETLMTLKRQGALIQTTASSHLGIGERRVRRRALKLLSLGLIDFIASDLHRPLSGLPLMRACRARIMKKTTPSTTNALFEDNARRLLLEKP